MSDFEQSVMPFPFLVLIIISLVGCEPSDVTGPPTENNPTETKEEKAEATLKLTNTGSLGLPDTADMYALRIGPDVFYGELPAQGESREVSVSIPPETHFVGMVIYSESSGEAYAFARSNGVITFSVGETVEVSLADSFFDVSPTAIRVSGGTSIGSSVGLRYETEVTAEELLTYFFGNQDRTYYASEAFDGIADAQVQGTRSRNSLSNSSPAYGISIVEIDMTEALQEAFYARFSFSISDSWRRGGKGPGRVFYPSLEDAPLDMQSYMSKVDVEFLDIE